MVIRRADINDLSEVYALEKICFKNPYPKEVLYLLISLYPELFLVIELENKIVGYVAGVVRSDRYGHIVSVCVHPMYRRRGFGAELIGAIEKIFAKDFNVCRYRLEVRTSNTAAINLYKKLGYNIIDKIRYYYPDGEDAYVMIKDMCKSNNLR